MTKAADALNADIDRMMWPVNQNGQPVTRMLNSVQDAKLYQRELSGMQTQLRNYKKEINLIKKQVHLSYQTARTNASQHPIMRLFGAKKQANHARAIDRQNMQIQEHNALVPYEAAIDRIDRCIMVVEDLKLKVSQGIQGGQLRYYFASFWNCPTRHETQELFPNVTSNDENVLG